MPQITINGLNIKPSKNNSWKVGIFTKDKNDNEVWINGFLNNHPTWQKGDTVELDVYNDPKWGLQFRMPEQEKQQTSDVPNLDRIKQLELRVSVLEGKLDALEVHKNSNDTKETVVSPPKLEPGEQTAKPGDANYINVDNIPW